MFKIVANIRQRNRWALIVIALLISLSVSLMQYFFSVQKSDAGIINIAGKQRMLSQKIAWHGSELLTSTTANFEHRKSLERSLLLFKANHRYVMSKDENGYYKYLAPELIKLYTEKPVELSFRINAYIQTVEGLLYRQEINDPDIFSVQRVEELLRYLDQAVSLFEAESVTKVSWISSIELFFWLLIMLLLIGVLRFVFVPMEKQVTNALVKYQKQKELAQQISQNKEHFIARASHEFRTPLQGLIASINDLDIKEQQKDIKKQATYCATRIIAMLDELQDLQALSLGEWSLKPTNEHVLRTIEKIVFAYEFGYSQKNIELNTTFDSTLNCNVELDHLRLQQVLAELLGNALKFTEQGSVNIKAKIKQSVLCVVITDTGCGFPESAVGLSFDVLNESNHFQGLKTGLARVKYIVDAFNGDISFQNRVPIGAQVILNVPVVITEAHNESDGQLYKVRAFHCLVVEDNPLNMHILTRVLTSLNYTYDCAENGKIACQMASDNQYDVILMDLNMPIMDGFEACKIIRTFDSHTPIIIVTANTSKKDIALADECGASDHVFKPINKQTISEVLMSALKCKH